MRPVLRGGKRRMTHTETVRRRKRGDGVTEREMETKREKKEEKERKQTHVEIGYNRSIYR
jgi:hypothetical protein